MQLTWPDLKVRIANPKETTDPKENKRNKETKERSILVSGHLAYYLVLSGR